MADTTNPAAVGTPERAYSPRERVPKAGPAIRQALGPPLRERFEVELRAALEAAEHDLDLDRAQQVIERWWPRALLAANPEIQAGIDADRRRLEAGDHSVLAGDIGRSAG